MSYGKIGLTTVAGTHDLLSGMPYISWLSLRNKPFGQEQIFSLRTYSRALVQSHNVQPSVVMCDVRSGRRVSKVLAMVGLAQEYEVSRAASLLRDEVSSHLLSLFYTYLARFLRYRDDI